MTGKLATHGRVIEQHAMRSNMSLRRSSAIVCVCLAAMLATGCATRPTDPELLASYEEANDPLEPMNRYFFEVNYALDELLLKPIAGWYYVALPNPVQDSIRNALRNLRSPVILANDLFQGNMERAEVTVSRFFINSTIGLLGLFDVAAEMGMPFHDEDFGQTLAVASVGEGPYIVIPLLGPSNPRDLTGRVVDFFLDPFDYFIQDDAFGYGRNAAEGLDTRARNLKTLDEIRAGSIDYYATIRSLYRQRRDAQIRNGEPAPDAGTYPGITFEEDSDFEDLDFDPDFDYEAD